MMPLIPKGREPTQNMVLHKKPYLLYNWDLMGTPKARDYFAILQNFGLPLQLLSYFSNLLKKCSYFSLSIFPT